MKYTSQLGLNGLMIKLIYEWNCYLNSTIELRLLVRYTLHFIDNS